MKSNETITLIIVAGGVIALYLISQAAQAASAAVQNNPFTQAESVLSKFETDAQSDLSSIGNTISGATSAVWNAFTGTDQ